MTLPLLIRAMLAPVTFAPVVSVTTPRMDAASESVAEVKKNRPASAQARRRTAKARWKLGIGIVAPSFPSERDGSWARHRTGLLTCAPKHLGQPPSQSRSAAPVALRVDSRWANSPWLKSCLVPLKHRREQQQVRSQLRGSGGFSPPSRASWHSQ